MPQSINNLFALILPKWHLDLALLSIGHWASLGLDKRLFARDGEKKFNDFDTRMTTSLEGW
jgi:hypothetical protein